MGLVGYFWFLEKGGREGEGPTGAKGRVVPPGRAHSGQKLYREQTSTQVASMTLELPGDGV